MTIRWADVYPVLTSIVVILLVAVVQRQSKTLAAVLATMPLNAPLAMWVVAAASEGEKELADFTGGMMVSIWPTVAFLLVAWLASRAAWRLPSVLLAGYVAWGLGLGLVLLGRRLLGG